MRLSSGALSVEGVSSPHSLRDASRGVYGEAAGEWTAADARGFARLFALPSVLHARAGLGGESAKGAGDRARAQNGGSHEIGPRATDRLGDAQLPALARGAGHGRDRRGGGRRGGGAGARPPGHYNQLELPSGRMSKVKRGDVVAAALGHRKALFGYQAMRPSRCGRGDRLHLLNLGGVLGQCDSVNPDLGRALPVRGARAGVDFPFSGSASACRRTSARGPFPSRIASSCGDAGGGGGGDLHERGQDLRGLRPGPGALAPGPARGGGKLTGVSLRRDILAMEDAGACHSLLFTDFGAVTITPEVAPDLARSILTQLAAEEPDVIVAELGRPPGSVRRGRHPQRRGRARALRRVLARRRAIPRPPGGVELLRERHGPRPTVITGPATDNAAGTRRWRRRRACRAATPAAPTEPDGRGGRWPG